MKFVAFDGKIFNTMEECVCHEQKEIQFYDSNGTKIALTPETDLDDLKYIYCGSIEALLDYDKQTGRCFHYHINSVGWWYWDDDDREWEGLIKELQNLKNRIETIETMFKKMREI